MKTLDYDVIIVGGGPAGLTAGIYCARANKSTLVLEKFACGGKIVETPAVENIPGFTFISGSDFASQLYDQALSCNVNTEEFVEVVKIDSTDTGCDVYTEDGNLYHSKVCIIATGTKNRVLGIESEEQWIGKNISFCVTCDGPFYKDKTVAVVGGGNSAVTEALELSEIASKVYIVQDLPKLTAEQTLIDRLPENVEVITSARVIDYVGKDDNFEGIMIEHEEKAPYDNWFESYLLSCDGVFLAIGLVPQNDFLASSESETNKIQLDNRGFISTNFDGTTTDKNIFACGDCASNTQKQVAIACGSGATAALNAINYLRNLGE